MILVFERLSLVSFFSAKFFGIFGAKVLITTSERSFLVEKIIGTSQEHSNIVYAKYNQLEKFQAEIYAGDSRQLVNLVTDQLYKSFNSIEYVSGYFPGVTDFNAKFRISIVKQIYSKARSHIDAMHWLECSSHRKEMLIYVSPISYEMKAIWDCSPLRLFWAFNYTTYTLRALFFLIKKISSSSAKIIIRSSARRTGAVGLHTGSH